MRRANGWGVTPLILDKPNLDKSKSGVPASPALFTFSLLVITLWGLATARPFLVPVALAALLAFLMTPFVDLMNRKLRLPEGLSLVLSVLILLFPVAGLGYLLVRQGQSLVQDFPAIIATLNGSFLKFTQTGLGHSLHLQDATDLNAVLDKVSSEATRGVALLGWREEAPPEPPRQQAFHAEPSPTSSRARPLPAPCSPSS